jgi:hypothetical protein
MTQQRRIEDVITEWLEEEAPDRMPDWALRAALEHARRSRRVRVVPGWRWYTMPRYLPWAVGLGATAVIALILAGPLGRGPESVPGVGGPPSAPAETASPRPSPTPSATPVATFAGVRPFEGVVGRLEPGTYSITSIEPLELRFTVPAGWEVPPGAPEFLGPTGRDGREIGGLSFWSPTLIESDPCRSNPKFQIQLPADAEVADVIERLAAVWGPALSTPVDTTLGGFEGSYATVTGPSCGAVARYWVLDVAGQTIVVIAHVWAESSAAQAAELQGIVDSVEIDAP